VNLVKDPTVTNRIGEQMRRFARVRIGRRTMTHDHKGSAGTLGHPKSISIWIESRKSKVNELHPKKSQLLAPNS
jgi:hypothetical protein